MKRMLTPIVAVVFVLAAGTFGTLWLLERNGHSKTVEELTTLRTEADGAKTQLAEAEKKRAEWDKKIVDVSNARVEAEDAARSSHDCVEAARKWVQLPTAADFVVKRLITGLGAYCDPW